MANNNNTGRQIEMTSMLVDIYFTDGNALLSNSKDQIQKKKCRLTGEISTNSLHKTVKDLEKEQP